MSQRTEAILGFLLLVGMALVTFAVTTAFGVIALLGWIGLVLIFIAFRFQG
jgi:hypothetical protein